VASVPHDRAEGVQIPHARALVAVLAYGSAALALVLLGFAAARTGDSPGPSAENVTPPPVADLLARRALAARAQRAVYVVEGPTGGRGSGFVAWVQKGRNRSYVITARAVVAGILADGGRTVYVKRGGSFWLGSVVRDDPLTGLALIRVDTVLTRPLWQLQVDHASLERRLPATIVPAGPRRRSARASSSRPGTYSVSRPERTGSTSELRSSLPAAGSPASSSSPRRAARATSSRSSRPARRSAAVPRPGCAPGSSARWR
jgi:hypothetical protein